MTVTADACTALCNLTVTEGFAHLDREGWVATAKQFEEESKAGKLWGPLHGSSRHRN
jgi:hypothetical protein